MARKVPARKSDQRGGCVVVGVGASAGGLDAFRRLLGALPPDARPAFVLVQHLDPARPTRLDEILSSATTLPVTKATDALRLEPGNVYVVPEGSLASLESGSLRLRTRTDRCAEQPIDTFFASLAAHSAENACGVLLSGLGSDGVHGLEQIAASGGLVFVQSPETAEHDAMPRAAIAARAADVVAAPEDLARRLLDHTSILPRTTTEPTPADLDATAGIIGLLAREAGLDFSLYKQTTVRRRIGRRALLRDLPDLDDYLRILRDDADERQALVNDLLINVTEFFRDQEVFDALRARVFPRLLERKTEVDTVRVWVPACSTGEEVYSLLIVLLEAMEDLERKPAVTVFGTDASDAAVRAARAGVFAESLCARISPERLARFFERVEGGYRVRKPLREMCVFARQDITTDTPFSRLDVVSLRNLLIYFQQPLQKRVLAIAHFALVPSGFLVLGTSETPDAANRLFSAFDRQRHIYRRRDVPASLPPSVTGPSRIPLDAARLAAMPYERSEDFDVRTEADQLTLAAFGPPRVVIDSDGHILHFFGDTSPYLEHPQGRATFDIREMVRPALALELADAVEAASSAHGPSVREATVAEDGQQRRVTIQVLPLAGPSDGPRHLVVFVDMPLEHGGQPAGEGCGELADLYEAREERLRRELSALRARVRTVGEEKDLVNEALRSASEEIGSSNEELQSINEELETAKEELQSSNEELVTVNEELRQRNADLARLNDDLSNFAASSDIPVVFVDRELRIRRHTPQTERVMHIVASDEGRFLPHLRLRVGVPDIEQAVRAVIESGRASEREVRDEDGCWYSMRVRPYRDAQERIDGAVLSFIDIDELKHGMRRIERRAELSAALSEVDAAIASVLDPDAILQHALGAGVAALGVDAGTIEVFEDSAWEVRYEYGLGPDIVGSRLGRLEAPIATRAARDLQPQVVPDVEGDPPSGSEFARRIGSKAILAVPLVVKGEATGCVLFHDLHAPRAFTRSEVDFARRLATSVWLALENARLLEAERHSARLAETLNRVNEILLSALTPSDVLARLVGEVSEVAGADKSLVIEVRGDEFTVTHVRDVRDDIVGVPKDATFFPGYALTARERRPVLIEDNWNDPRTNKDFVVPYQLRAFQLMPLIVEDEVVAVLAFAYDAPRSFDAEDERFCERMSTAMSLALRNARLYESEARAAARLALLAESARLLLTTEAPEAVVQSIAEQVMAYLDCQVFFNYLMEDDGEGMRLNAYAGIPADTAEGIAHLDLGVAVCGCVGRDGCRIIAEDIQHTSDERAALVRSFGVQAYACHPLVYQGMTIGTLSFGTRRRTRFTDAELELMKVVADQAATAMARKRAEDGMRRGRAELLRRAAIEEGIKHILQAGLSAETDEELGEMCLAVAEKITASAFGFIGEIGPDGRLNDIALSDPGRESCTTQAASGHRGAPRGFLTHGLYRRVLAEGESVFTNSPAEHPDSSGVPDGHPPLTAFLGVPLVSHGRATGMIAVANKAGGYGHEDREAVEALAPAIVEAFQRKRAERALRESRQDLSRAQAVARLGSWRLDTRRDELLWSDETYHLFGVPAGTPLTYESFLSRIHPDDRERVDAAWTAALSGEPYDIEHRIVVGGETKWVREQAELEVDAGGGLRGGFGTVQDITERKLAEQRLQREHREVEVSNRFLGLFVQETGEDLYDKALDVLLEATESEQGAFGYIAEEGDLVCPTMSRVFDQCEMTEADKCVVYQRHTWTGLWSRALREMRSLSTNEPSAVPPGHVPIDNNLATPILFQGRPIGLFNLANKAGGYTPEDVAFVSAVADRIAPVLYAWIQRRLREQERQAAEEQRERYLGKLVQLLEVSADVLAARTLEEMMQRICDASREMVGARYAVSGHGYREDSFRVGTTSRAADTPCCPEGSLFLTERGGVYLSLIDDRDSIRLDDEALRSHPRWQGLPDGHGPLRGLLGARLTDGEGRAVGLVMLSDKIEGDFTEEDELLLRQLASITSLGLQHIEARQEIDDERGRLRTIIDEIPVGITLLDPDGAVLEVNEANAGIWGGTLPKAGSVGEYTMYRAFHHGTKDPMQPTDWPAVRVIESGLPAQQLVDIRRFDGTAATVDLRVLPITNAEGRTVWILGITEDVTERLEDERLKEALDDIATTVAGTLETDEILHRAIAKAAEALGAESAAIEMRERDGWVVWEVRGLPRESVGRVTPDAQAPVNTIVSEARRPLAFNDTEHDARIDPETLRGSGVRSLLSVPLIAHNRVVGVVAFHHRSAPTPFLEPHIEFATKLMSVITLALENARLYERERRIANTLQEAILAPPEPVDHMEMAYLYRPASKTANVGGDFYDLFQLGPDRAVIVVGDVSGKGIEAARLTSLVRDGIRSYAYEHVDPAEILARVNHLVARFSPTEMFATVFLGILDLHTGELRHCSAGHAAPFVLGERGVDRLTEPRSTIIGAFAEAAFRGDEATLRPEDTLVLFTDGVTEARRDGELFGEARLGSTLDALETDPLSDLPDRLLAKVLEFSDGRLQDDTVVLCVRWLGPDGRGA